MNVGCLLVGFRDLDDVKTDFKWLAQNICPTVAQLRLRNHTSVDKVIYGSILHSLHAKSFQLKSREILTE